VKQLLLADISRKMQFGLSQKAMKGSEPLLKGGLRSVPMFTLEVSG
jgi:hypothetical protein